MNGTVTSRATPVKTKVCQILKPVPLRILLVNGRFKNNIISESTTIHVTRHQSKGR